MLSKTWQKRRQIDAWEFGELELETKIDREMSIMSMTSMMSSQLHAVDKRFSDRHLL